MKGQKKQSLALMLSSLIMLVVLVGGTWSTAFAANALPSQNTARSAFIIPTFNINSVSEDVSVTITTYNFPAGDTFRVLMNYIGTRGVGGIHVATVNSGAGGSFIGTFNIPDALKGQSRIAIRLESPTSGYFSYNWFYNSSIPVTGPTVTPGGPTVTPGTPVAPLPPFVIPTFSITDVTRDATVSIRTANFPVNDTFDVLMNYMGTHGVGGIKVATFNSGAGGTLAATFNVPDALKGQTQIAIRLQSPTSGYYAFNWFWNNTSGGIPVSGPTPTPFVTPTFSITGVARDATVSIQTANFPANDTFTVTMGLYGTRGIGGVNVGTFNSGAGGALTATFNIPDALKGQDRIAIRLQSPTSGYFSYNWFWNSNAP